MKSFCHIGLTALLATACTADLPSAAREALAPGSGGPAAPAGSMFVDGTYNSRNYKLYVPSGYAASPLPLVVMMHGCGQTPADFAAGTQMNTIAEANTFFALYPEQSSSDNSQECWNWFVSSDQTRGSGEPADVVGIVDQVAGSYQVDATRVYAAGVSAGAAMAVILGATYPDRFEAIVSGEGLEYKAATSVSAAINAESAGGPSPDTQGQAAYAAMGAHARIVRTLVIQGSSDGTVAPVNGDQVLAQWAEADDLASDGTDDDNISAAAADSVVSGQVPGGHAFVISSYKDKTSGKVVLEKLVVTGMDHAWSGGSNAGSYTDPMGPNASQLAWDFFSGKSPDVSLDGGLTPVDAAMASATDAAVSTPADLSTVTSDGMEAPHSGGGCSMTTSPSASSVASLGLALLLVALRRRRARHGV
jgi:poly(hydroxyalkanoate) depolymerase family esterase